MRLRFGFGRLTCNHHDWRPKRGLKSEWPEYESTEGHVKRSCAAIYILGRDCYLIVEGRRMIGWRLYFYGPTGACVHFDAMLVFKRSPWRPPSKYAPKPDWKPPQAIQL